MNYQCSITVDIDAESPEEAARKAQDIIDENTDYWMFDIEWFHDGYPQRQTIDAAKAAL